jgi:hypothetical protein
MAAKKGLELLYNLLLKDAVMTSGPRSGILSIGPDTRKFAQKKFEAFVEGAKRQGVDLDKYTEQELKYIIELNKPKSPKVIPADSPEGKGITEALFGKKGEVIKADFGEPFAEQAKKFKGPVQTTEDMGELGKVNVDIDYSASLDKPEFFGADAKNMFGEPVKTGSEYFKDMKQFHLNQINRKKKEMVPPTHPNYKLLKKSLQDQEDSLVAAQITEELGGNQNMYDFLRSKQISDPNAKPLKKSDYVKTDDPVIKKDKSKVDEIMDDMKEIEDPEDMATGGRVGFKDGMSRRKFLQIMGGLGSIPILGKFVKFGKAAKSVKAVPIVKTPPVEGKPAWFDSLVNKVIKEGDDMTKQFATKDREIVHATKIDEDAYVRVHQDLDTGTVRVDIDDATTNVMGDQGDAIVSLEFKPGLADETTKGKPPDTFTASENDYRNYADGPDDYVTETVENVVTDTKDLTADLTKVKLYAKGQKKPTINEMMIQKKRKKLLDQAEKEPSQYAADRGPDYDPDYYGDDYDYASGGIAGMLGE